MLLRLLGGQEPVGSVWKPQAASVAMASYSASLYETWKYGEFGIEPTPG